MNIEKTKYKILQFLKDHKVDINITDDALRAAVSNVEDAVFLSAKEALIRGLLIDKNSANLQWRITPSGETELLNTSVGEMIGATRGLFDRASVIGGLGLAAISVQCILMSESNQIARTSNSIIEQQYKQELLLKKQSVEGLKEKTLDTTLVQKIDTVHE